MEGGSGERERENAQHSTSRILRRTHKHSTTLHIRGDGRENDKMNLNRSVLSRNIGVDLIRAAAGDCCHDRFTSESLDPFCDFIKWQKLFKRPLQVPRIQSDVWK